MGGIAAMVFGGGSSKKAPQVSYSPPPPNYQFSNNDTTKSPGLPLPVVYGQAHIYGNKIYNRLSSDKKNLELWVSIAWGPLNIIEDTIRVNEKRPEYINGVLNSNRSAEPGFLSGVNVWVYSGTSGQTASSFNGVGNPPHTLEYNLNRTASIFVKAVANDDLSSVTKVEATTTRGTLFLSGNGYNTPIPPEIAAAWPSGIDSSNPIAAALDYLLNTDYGAGRDPSAFGDFQSWISGAAYCDQTNGLYGPIQATSFQLSTTAWTNTKNIIVTDNGRTLTRAA